MRSIVLSNGELCVALDALGLVRDIYYPYVGLEDHVRGNYIHRIGVWVDGQMSWFTEDSRWKIEVACEDAALSSAITAKHDVLGVELTFKDIVYNEKPVFLRRISVKNLGSKNRVIKLYFGHQFEIYKSHGSDTAYFDPLSHSVIHYKGRRVFLIGATLDGTPFEDYATGRSNFQGKEGSHRDADDGVLSKNPIEHGPADSVIGLYGSYAPQQSKTAYYWLAAAQSIQEAEELNDYIVKKTPEHLIKTATAFWNAWVNANKCELTGLSPEQAGLYAKSLMYIRAAVDKGGGILASSDSDMLQYGLDTYSYVWPRDAAYTALALDSAGDTNVAKRFFEFCRDTITPEGYFMHKYLPDRSLGSSWHPWIANGKFQLPIQEDETALVLYALYRHYEKSHDLEFLEEMYNPLVEKAANFLVRYRDAVTGLPDKSYDLWERKRGTSTFTSAAVYGALIAAAELSKILGKDTHEEKYRRTAEEVRAGILEHLWDAEKSTFVNMISASQSGDVVDRTIDISGAYGVFAFGVMKHDDPKLARAFETCIRTLSAGIPSGGLARFEEDDYYRISKDAPGNPWVVTTLWYAEFLIANARTAHDLDRVRDIFNWVLKHAQKSGVLSEQLDPRTGNQVGATPLTWSHAAYVLTVLKYIEKVREIGVHSRGE
ncbi:glycoside hydrolase family 15 protein [Candidatus Kaiserbacteria bacterium]|nr:glycoside hydrolase family 15 protein [Candidatus Kaiserbacteria bacterium]